MREEKGAGLPPTVTRRRFLISALGLGAALAEAGLGIGNPRVASAFPTKELRPNVDQAISPEKAPSAKRFFENIDGFNPAEFSNIAEGLTGFGSDFKDQLAIVGVDPEGWKSGVQVAVETLKKLHLTYNALVSDGTLKDDASKKYFRDGFYELGSACWGVLRIGELWKDKKGELSRILSEYTKIYNNAYKDERDALLGDELFSISAKWTDSHGIYISPSVNLLLPFRNDAKDIADTTPNCPGFARIPEFFLPDMPYKVGTQALANYEVDEQSELGYPRPKKTVLYFADEQTKAEVIKILEKYGLERVVPAMGNLESVHIGGYNPFERKIGLPTQLFSGENFERYREAAEDILIHEVGHALEGSLVRLDDPVLAQRLMAKIRMALAPFRPYPSSSGIFSPDGERVRKDFVDERTGLNLDAIEEDAKKINNATITRAALGKYLRGQGIFYTSTNGDQSGGSLESSSLAFLKKVGRYLKIPDENMLSVLHLRTNPQIQNMSFERFDQFYATLKRSQNPDAPLTGIEKLLFQEIEKNMALYDQPENKDFYPKYVPEKDVKGDRWFKYMLNVILPITLSDLAVNNPDAIRKALFNGKAELTSADRRIDHDLELLVRWVDLTVQSADRELWGDASSKALRQDAEEEGLEINIDRAALNEVRAVVQEIITTLIDRGFALHGPSPVGIAA